MKQGIGHRAYGQKDPLVEYKKESYELFTAMMDRIEDETVRYLFFLQVNTGAGPVAVPRRGGGEKRKQPPARMPSEQQRQAAKNTMEDFTRNIQRKKEKELADLQLRAAMDPQRAASERRREGRPQRSLPLRQRQEIQEVPRSMSETDKKKSKVKGQKSKVKSIWARFACGSASF